MREIDLSDLVGIWFHDVIVTRISVDYLKREAALDCVIQVGFWNSPNRFGVSEGEVKGTLVFTGLLFWVMQPPEGSGSYKDSEGIEIGSDGPVQKGTFVSPLPEMPEDLPEIAFLHYLYMSEWNSCIFVAATGAHFQQN